MKNKFPALVLASFLLSSGPVVAGAWLDSYWPLHDGDTKTFVDNSHTSLKLDIFSNGPGEFEMDYSSPGYSESDFFQKTDTAIFLDVMSSGAVEIELYPGIILVNDTLLQKGGSVSSATTASLWGYEIPATFTTTISTAGTVVVPAGTFANCRNIVVKMAVPGQGSSTVFSAVLAPGVGIIKEWEDGGIWAQLVSGTVGGTDVGILATGAPVLRIKTPVNGQRIATSTNNVTVTGSVSGYAPGMKVFYRMNSNEWSSAALMGTNWSGSVLVDAGTNVLNAYAADSVGRTSSVAVVKFQYVVTGILGVQTAGKGTLTPNYSNAMLEIGRSYSMSAKPATGYAFTNWTGRMNGEVVFGTNKAMLNFVMKSNLVLTASFVDVQKPVLKITTPVSRQRWSNQIFMVKGTATDNGPMDSVKYQLNDGAWTNDLQTVNGWSNWTASVTLVPGTNTIRAYAIDATGNRSPTNTVSFTYVLSGVLRVGTVGKGTVSPNYSNVLLELGSTCVLTAKPVNGYAFTNWMGQVNGEVVFGTNKPVLKFMMQSNLVLTATFVDVQKPVLTIIAPVSKQRWSNVLFTVAGRVTDNGPLAEVHCQLNGGGWTLAQTANHWSNWTASVTLVPGTNVVRAYAVDAAGNRSLTNSVTLTCVAMPVTPDPDHPLRFDCSNGAMSVLNGCLQMKLSGPSGTVVVVEACTNLHDSVWLVIGTNTLTGGSCYFNDPQWTNYPSRFYRFHAKQ